jgi:anti-anti-sigma factor
MDRRSELVITCVRRDEELDIAIAGELDLVSVWTARRELEPLDLEAHRSVVVSLGDVTFIDSAGLKFLLLLRNRLGGRLRIGERSGVVARMLEISGVEELFC